SLGLVGSTPPGKLIIRNNTITRTFASVGDADDPHPDPIQLYMNDKTAPYTSGDWDIDISANMIFAGVARGEQQGLFISNNAPGQAYKGRITGNMVLSKGANNTCYVLAVRDMYVHGNTFARYNPADAANTSGCNVTLGPEGSYGHTYFGDNIGENFIINSGS